MGRLVGSLPVAPLNQTECSFWLKDAESYDKVRPTGGKIPAYITGSLGCVPEFQTVAIAVNGIIRATGETFPGYAQQMSLAAMVPETAIRAGRNSVEVYLIDQRGDGDYRLLKVRRSGE